MLKGAAGALAATFCPTVSAAAAAALGIVEVAPGAFVHKGRYEEFSPENQGDINNIGFVVGNSGVAVIDTGGSPIIGRALLGAIRGVTDLPIRWVINTHVHPDHVFGNIAFADGTAKFIAHHKFPRALATRKDRYLSANRINLGDTAFAGTEIVLPTDTVETRREIDLGGRTLVLEAHKTAHTDNDLTVHDLTTDTLFLGDLLFVERMPSIDGSIRGWLQFLETLATRPVARVVPGHGPPSVAWPDGARPLQRYLSTIASEVRAMVKAGKTMREAMAVVGQSEKDAWVLFEGYNARNVSAAFAELEWE